MIELTLAERAVQTHFSGEIQIPSLPQLTFSQRGVIHCGSLESHPKIKFLQNDSQFDLILDHQVPQNQTRNFWAEIGT